MMSTAELRAIAAAAHIDIDTEPARVIRRLLADRYGADMVTDDMVRVTTAAALAQEG